MFSASCVDGLMRKLAKRQGLILFVMLAATVPRMALADGSSIDKVYYPYVQPLEREVEYRALYFNDDDDERDGGQVHRLGLGRSLTDRLFSEFYLIGEKESRGRSFSLEAYEAELKWQLTEQGEYFADWGLLFELETERDDNAWEYATTVLVAKDFGRWTGTVNLGVIYEWGSDVSNEWETSLASQLRYRYRPQFETGVELYSGDTDKGIGPVVLGDVRFAAGRKLHWEAGIILGLDSDSADQTLRALLEYEF
jgi:hypothetical protein